MACIGNLTDTSHFIFLFGIKIKLFMFLFSRFFRFGFSLRRASEENGFFILLRQPLFVFGDFAARAS